MNDITYRLVYDASNQFLFFPLGLLGMIIGIAIGLSLLDASITKKETFKAIFVFIWLFLWIAMGGLFQASVFITKSTCKQWAKSGDYKLVAGIVENFHPMPFSGHDTEHFTVNGIKFEYSDFDLSNGSFNKTSSYGGPIREGLKVKIAYRDGRILKLWINDNNK